VLRIERRSVVENSLAFRAVITCGRRVARQSGTLRAIWQPPPPPPPPPPSEPAQATHLRLTLTGAQGSAFQERDLVTNTVTQTPTPSGAPSIKASSSRTSETIAGTATVDGPLAPGEVLYVYATANLLYHALCNGPSSCTFNVPREPPGTDRFDEVVAMICAGPPAAITGCGDPRIVEVDVDWDPS